MKKMAIISSIIFISVISYAKINKAPSNTDPAITDLTEAFAKLNTNVKSNKPTTKDGATYTTTGFGFINSVGAYTPKNKIIKKHGNPTSSNIIDSSR